jgi:hypothetical protein
LNPPESKKKTQKYINKTSQIKEKGKKKEEAWVITEPKPTVQWLESWNRGHEIKIKSSVLYLPLEEASSREEPVREEVDVEEQAAEERKREQERRRIGWESLGKEERWRRRSNSPARGISAMVLG